jgi:branched-chain amino acid transport system ATP-binding protein
MTTPCNNDSRVIIEQVSRHCSGSTENHSAHKRKAGESQSEVPYGRQRKLEIARAMATGPKLLLLDEPAAGMNPNETAGLMETIQLIRDRFDMTILLIEHDMKLVAGICERLTVLNFGRVLKQGSTREVLDDQEVIKAYIGE